MRRFPWAPISSARNSDTSPKVDVLSALPFLLLIPFASLPILTRSIVAYYPLAYGALAYSVIFMVLKSLRSQQVGTLPILIGGIGVASAAVNDFLFSSFRIHTGNYISAAIVVFIHFMSISLSSRYMAAFAQIETLLAEKDKYLKEMHHRVKNSLQIVASVVTLQINRIRDPAAQALFSRMRERIRSVALVHEKLNFSLSGDDVDIADYVRDLVAQVVSVLETESGAAPPELIIGDKIGSGKVEFCVDFGLVLTELIINAYQHGGGAASIKLFRTGEVLNMEVLDVGPGFPEGFDERSNARLGFKIITSVVSRRGGKVRIVSGAGGHITLSIPMPA
jgi:two-component sensor histidine kinase